ncbi:MULTISPECIES: alkaline phosphatase [unclassified Stenotrophomonas]|uniref:alkaline phosphatase n=1 Tax=unclassified Stenotrophomonas TaxID=196198 RepID=UPI0017843381|nr:MULTISPECIES: alkaline phosphatase [unclassified Stenotrophomonas]MBD8636858.1 alkaline phosphatase [Stenotrophomonas sp. CFBP 13725]MBD8696232.1 alkaline phosphatase [Stenotrophomonas sp. CFBP 13718]
MIRTTTLLAATAATLLLGACSSTPQAAGPAGLTVAVPAVTHPDGETPQWWYRSGAAQAAGNGAMNGKAKNVILFLGDGMSLTTVAAARIFEGQRKGSSGEENLLSWEHFPATAFSKTYNVDSQTPDSAGTMTAITTGVKTHMGAIGVSAGKRPDCADSLQKGLLSWLQLADSAGMATGIVSTARLTHATPAATYAHSPERNWENDTDLTEEAKAAGCKDIAQQLLSTARFGRGPLVALGGGRGEFTTVEERDPEYDDKVGQRLDGRSLVTEWQQAHPQGAYVWNAAQLKAAGNAPAILGLFEPDHMQYEHERAQDPGGEPSLAELTRTAITNLSRHQEGYVLMIEGARIDHANHSGNAYRALTDTVAMSDAVRVATELTKDDDTLIIVTADHSHTLNFVGYPARGNPILGKVKDKGGEDGLGALDLARDGGGQPYTTLTYANGPGFTGATNQQPAGPKRYPHNPSSFDPSTGRPDLTAVDTEHPDYMQEALVPGKSESHGGEDVGIWARGPGSKAIRGTLEQNAIYHMIVQATPRLRERLCEAGTCDGNGVPVELPAPVKFERKPAAE